jgi:hypothetical protein
VSVPRFYYWDKVSGLFYEFLWGGALMTHKRLRFQIVQEMGSGMHLCKLRAYQVKGIKDGTKLSGSFSDGTVRDCFEGECTELQLPAGTEL